MSSGSVTVGSRGGVDGVAQGVAEQAGRQHGRDEGRGRQHEEPGAGDGGLAARGEQGAEGHVGHLDAEAEEAQRALGQDHRADAERRVDDEQRGHVRQDVPADDRERGHAHEPCGLDVVALPQRHRLAADDTRHDHPAEDRQTDDERHPAEVLEQRAEEHERVERRDDEQQVDAPDERAVDEPAEVARDRADDARDERGGRPGDEADEQRLLQAHEGLRVDVLTDVVRAEPVGGARSGAEREPVGVDGVPVVQVRADEGPEEYEQQRAAADAGAPGAEDLAPERRPAAGDLDDVRRLAGSAVGRVTGGGRGGGVEYGHGSHPHSRVERGVEQVREGACDEHEDRREEDRARCRVDVVVGDALHEVLAHAVPAEDQFGDARAGQDQPERVREERRHRDERDPDAVPHDGRPARPALRPGRPDEVVRQDVEHRRPLVARVRRDGADGQRDRGEQQVHESVAEDGEEPGHPRGVLTREADQLRAGRVVERGGQDHQDDRDDEGRRGQDRERQVRRDLVGRPVLPDRVPDAEQHTEQRAEQRADDEQAEARAGTGDDVRRHLGAAGTDAEGTVRDEPGPPVPGADEQRGARVGAELLQRGVDRALRHGWVAAEEPGRRVQRGTGEQVPEGRRDDRQDDVVDDPLRDEGKHGRWTSLGVRTALSVTRA
ncbi:hypothetical protein Cus16_1120 [Curtobacterium sp. ER1/6]|nr:hypothetical protein Cus16_1120 [Curtobacterium sp. ER1/6]